ncbi:MAG: amidase [Pseudomonadota bacterium]
MSELAYLPFTEAARRIANGDLSSVAYTQALLDRIEAHDAKFNAFLNVQSSAAMEAAAAADEAVARGELLGPIHGVPYALKDIIDAKGLTTTAHSAILKDNVAPTDAYVTARLRAAGGILLGKLSTHEFAIGGPCFDLPWPPARNPWNPNMFPGGSSSGSGAAVAAGFVGLALGSDTGGSVRNPASMCNLVGIKPTYGRVSRRGVVPLSFSLDNVGPLTRTVEENAVALGVIAGFDADDPASVNRSTPDYAQRIAEGVKGWRIGLLRHFYTDDLAAEAQVASAINEAAETLANLGATVDDVRTEPLAEFAACNRIILLSEAFAIHETWLKERPQDYGALTRSRILPGAFFQAHEYVQALRTREKLRHAVDQLFQSYDILLTASSMEPPFPMDDPEQVEKYYPRQARTPFNVTGHPAVVVPAGMTDTGLPLSVQLIGRYFDEAAVYRAAYAYEAVHKWYEQHPNIA